MDWVVRGCRRTPASQAQAPVLSVSVLGHRQCKPRISHAGMNLSCWDEAQSPGT